MSEKLATETFSSNLSVASLKTSFTQPAVGSSVTATVTSTSLMFVGQTLFITGGGYYRVSTIPSGTTVTLRNLGYVGNAAAAATVAAPAGVGMPPPTKPIDVYELDFSTQSNQTFGSNTGFTIDGKTWTVENVAGSSTFAIQNGTGLVMATSGSVSYATGTPTRTAPIISTPITGLAPDFDNVKFRFRVLAQLSTDANSAGEWATLGIDRVGATPMFYSLHVFGGHDGTTTYKGAASHIVAGAATAAMTDTFVAQNGTDDVMVLESVFGQVHASSGTYSGGWPTSFNKGMCSSFVPNQHMTNELRIFFAVSSSAGTAHSTTWKKLKLQVMRLAGG